MSSNSSPLQAEPGDRLVIRAHRQGESERDAEILEVLGDAGGPPFVVRWQDDGHVSRLYPGSDAYIQRLHRDTEEHPDEH